MGIAYNPRIVTDGLALALDAINTKSYPGSGTTWTDLSGLGNNGTLTNGPIQETSIEFINPISINKLRSSEVKITASDAAASDQFGYSVAVGSNKIVVGAPWDDSGGSQRGSVYVYDLDGSNEVEITASDGASYDFFGHSVAVGNDKIVVGSYGDDDNGTDSGSVYVYDLDGSNQLKITASDGAASDQFGRSVAIGNNKIVVGAHGDDDNGSSSGSVYVYDLDGSNEVKITASDGAADDWFGNSVAVGNDKIVVGAYWDDDNGSYSGSVYVYDLDGSNEVKITASDGAAYDYFGWRVAVGSNKIVVGSYWDDDNGSQSGSVYVYDLDGTNEVKITASDGADNDQFGYSVAVGNDKIVVGAWGDDDDGSGSGSVYVYDLDGSNEVKITASDGAAGDYFGQSVAVGSNKIVVGAYGDDDNNASLSGSAYVYSPPTISPTYIKFDGTDDYVDISETSSLNTDYATYEVWFNLDSVSNAASTGLRIIDRGNISDGTFAFIKRTAGDLVINMRDNSVNASATLPTSLDPPSTNQWYQVVATYDGTTLKAYINGEFDASLNPDNSGPLNTQGTLSIRLSSSSTTAGNNPFDGNIGAVKIYNRALSASEVQQNFNALRGRFGI